MTPEISFESIREVEDHLDDFLMVLQPKMEANVQRRRRMEEAWWKRKKKTKRVGIARCREVFHLLWKQLEEAHKKNNVPFDRDEEQSKNQIQKETMNRYLKRIGCPMRIL